MATPGRVSTRLAAAASKKEAAAAAAVASADRVSLRTLVDNIAHSHTLQTDALRRAWRELVRYLDGTGPTADSDAKLISEAKSTKHIFGAGAGAVASQDEDEDEDEDEREDSNHDDGDGDHDDFKTCFPQVALRTIPPRNLESCLQAEFKGSLELDLLIGVKRVSKFYVIRLADKFQVGTTNNLLLYFGGALKTSRKVWEALGR